MSSQSHWRILSINQILINSIKISRNHLQALLMLMNAIEKVNLHSHQLVKLTQHSEQWELTACSNKQKDLLWWKERIQQFRQAHWWIIHHQSESNIHLKVNFIIISNLYKCNLRISRHAEERTFQISIITSFTISTSTLLTWRTNNINREWWRMIW